MKDDFESTLDTKLQKMQDSIVLDSEYTRLETLFDGRDKSPKFDRVEIEDHMKKTGIYNPQKAFEDLYRDELYEFRHPKDDETERQESRRAFSEKPTRPGTTDPLTVDSLRERLARPDGQQWWEKNRERILPLMGQLTK